MMPSIVTLPSKAAGASKQTLWRLDESEGIIQDDRDDQRDCLSWAEPSDNRRRLTDTRRKGHDKYLTRCGDRRSLVMQARPERGTLGIRAKTLDIRHSTFRPRSNTWAVWIRWAPSAYNKAICQHQSQCYPSEGTRMGSYKTWAVTAPIYTIV